MPELPAYSDLPVDSHGHRSAWGLFGSTDSVGLFNLQTPTSVAAASRLVKQGKVFSLNASIFEIDPPFYGRGRTTHRLIEYPNGAGFDDVVDNFYPQVSSQWDALAHASYSSHVFYNGRSSGDVSMRGLNTIEHWARRGIAGRAVVADVALILERRGIVDLGRPISIDKEILDEALAAARVNIRCGDILLVHTGYLGWYRTLGYEQRRALAAGPLQAVGLEHTESMAEYLWDLNVCAVAADNPALEVAPSDSREDSWPFGYLHNMLIGSFGMAIGELWDLTALALDCRADGVYEAFLTSAPFHVPGGTGSPANALAIK